MLFPLYISALFRPLKMCYLCTLFALKFSLDSQQAACQCANQLSRVNPRRSVEYGFDASLLQQIIYYGHELDFIRNHIVREITRI